jgi:hypothetical protein
VRAAQRRLDPSLPPPFLLARVNPSRLSATVVNVVFVDEFDNQLPPTVLGIPRCTYGGIDATAIAPGDEGVDITFASSVPADSEFLWRWWDESVRFSGPGWAAPYAGGV